MSPALRLLPTLTRLRPQRRRPRLAGGVQWHGVRRVLARKAHPDHWRELWWVESAKVWGSRMEPSVHEPGWLVLAKVEPVEDAQDNLTHGGGARMYHGGHWSTREHTLWTAGGRLSRALLERFADEIDAFFDYPGLVASGVPLNATTLIPTPKTRRAPRGR